MAHARATPRSAGGRHAPPAGGDRPTLLQALHSAHWRLGMTAVVAAAVTLTLLSVMTLRTYVDRNLALIARAIAYAAEAAVVFDDAAAAQDTLQTIAAGEGLLAADIVRPDGSRLARFRQRPADALDETLTEFGDLLFRLQATSPVRRQGVEVGRVQVRGDGGVYLVFLLEVLAAIGVCGAVTAWRVSRLSHRVGREIVRPLNLLAGLTRRARLARHDQLRAPPAGVREIHELGEDINALLAEVASHEAELVAQHDTLRTANESLSFLAFHDSLTGLPNRARFMEVAARALQRHGQRGEKVAVLFIDHDDFKAINDNLGHAAGDELLVEMATRVRAQLRDGGFVARLGGDEFAVLLAPIGSTDDAMRVAARIADAVRQPLLSALFGRIDSSASIGVALFPDHGDDVERLLAAADVAMYRAKRPRGERAAQAARIRSYEPEMGYDTRAAELDG
ncbi:MAG: diguanylate cyclase [Ideonella sp.]|nr:diguanylate cyclase [Ideonella sp.]MCC7459101.1 diguanylate cyclase [Nitrospira sp.]